MKHCFKIAIRFISMAEVHLKTYVIFMVLTRRYAENTVWKSRNLYNILDILVDLLPLRASNFERRSIQETDAKLE